MSIADDLKVKDGICRFRPHGEFSLVEAVEVITSAIAYCRKQGIDKLLIDGSNMSGVPIPTIVDRFLMVEEWAAEAQGQVVAVLVVRAEYIHPKKFGVRVAADLGWVADVYSSEKDALTWLSHAAAAIQPRSG